MKQVNISFTISGTVEQTIEVPEDMSDAEIVSRLEAGTLFTTLTEGAGMIDNSLQQKGTVIETVISGAEFFDFEIED